MANAIFDVQLQDEFTQKSYQLSAGTFQVCVAGTAHKQALLDPDNNFAVLSNPVTPRYGKLRFAIAYVPGQAVIPPSVDIYGITAMGHFYATKGLSPGSPFLLWLNSNARQQVAIIPFSALDCVPGTEKDTGFALPANSLIQVCPSIIVTTAEATRTLSFGSLSTQSGGSATAFGTTLSLAALGGVKGSVTAPAFVTTAPELSYTMGAGATVAEGFISIPYGLPF